MFRRHQFSLGYLLLEMFWVAVALAATRAVAVAWMEEYHRNGTSGAAVLIPFAVWFWIIAIGGLFGRMTIGAAIGFLLFWPLVLLLPVLLPF